MAAQSKLRIGLIGYGNWARTAYVPALRADGRAEPVAVAAPSAATRERARGELGDQIALYAGAQELLAAGGVDAVLVAVGDAAHASALGAALSAGVPMLWEPPLAASVEAIPALIEQLLAARAPTHADIELSFLPVVARAAELVGAGAVGEPRQAEVRLDASWGASGELSRIALLAPWYVDPLSRVLDRTPRRVLALDGGGNAPGAQPQSLAVLDYDGVWGQLRANTGSVSDTVATTLQVVGSDGDLQADLISGELRWRSSESPQWSSERLPAQEPALGLPGMYESVSLFLDQVLGGAEAPGAAGARRLAHLHLVGLAAEASKRSGTWADIEAVPATAAADSL